MNAAQLIGAERALRGFDIIVSSQRGYYRPMAIGASAGHAENDEDALAPVAVQEAFDDGFTQAVTELMGDDSEVGFDMSSVSPYLSSFASGFGSGDKDKDKKDDKDSEKKRELERQADEAKRAASASKTALWVVIGLLGAGALATIIALLVRKRK